MISEHLKSHIRVGERRRRRDSVAIKLMDAAVIATLARYPQGTGSLKKLEPAT